MLRYVVSWTCICGKNLPARAKDVIPYLLQCQVMWFFPFPKTEQNQGTDKFWKPSNSLLFNFTALTRLFCLSSNKRDFVYCECLQKQRRGENILKHSQPNSYWSLWVSCRKSHVVWAHLFSGDGISPEINGSTGLQLFVVQVLRLPETLFICLVWEEDYLPFLKETSEVYRLKIRVLCRFFPSRGRIL